MAFVRTTLRIKEDLKKTAERKAFEEDISLQKVVNTALEEYLLKSEKKKAKEIVFKTHNLGVPLDNLTRDDFYPNPNPNAH
ncbi:MAG: hypothetical protein WD231_00930 [Candidatus Woykebacteria bacterium]